MDSEPAPSAPVRSEIAQAAIVTMRGHPQVCARSCSDRPPGATAGVKWSVIGPFENVARKGDGGPVQSRQAAKKTVNQRDIEEDASRSPALPLRPFSCTFGTALTLAAPRPFSVMNLGIPRTPIINQGTKVAQVFFERFCTHLKIAPATELLFGHEGR